MTAPQLERGRPGPFGAQVDGDGVAFAVFSEHAEAVELCLYDSRGERESARLALHRSGDVWHGRLPGAGAGLVYGLRAERAGTPALELRRRHAVLSSSTVASGGTSITIECG